MRKGKSLKELAIELTDIQDKKVDLIVPTANMKMNPYGEIYLEGNKIPENAPAIMKPTTWASSQIATYTNIPKAYYDRIHTEDPSILAMNVNHGLQMAINIALAKKSQTSRLIRTVDNNIRGFLSSRYRMLDSGDLLETILPILQQYHFNVVSSELTEKRMYLKVTTDRIQGEVKKGMVVQYGLVISSSDVGCGSVRVEPLMYECFCDNGTICQTSMRKFHVGKDQSSENIEALLSDATRTADDEVFWRKTRDVVIGSMNEINFERELNLLKEANEVKIGNIGNLEQVVELTMKEVGISGEKKKFKILEHLANGADGRGHTKYGLSNAFTWAAHQVEEADYEECTELERAGGKIIVMPKKTWEAVAC